MRRERKRALTRDASSQKLEIGKREHHRLEQDETGGVFNRNGQSGGSAYKGEMRAEYYFRIEAEGEHPEGSMSYQNNAGSSHERAQKCSGHPSDKMLFPFLFSHRHFSILLLPCLFWGCRSIQHLLHAQIAAQITPLGYQTAAAHIPAQKHVLPIAAPGRQHFGQIAVLIGTGIDGFYSLDEFLLSAAGIHGLQFGHFLAVVRVHSRRDQIPHLIHRCVGGQLLRTGGGTLKMGTVCPPSEPLLKMLKQKRTNV